MQPLIIFGTRPRTTTIDKGNFTCPKCGGYHPYERKNIRHVFTIYFVPLIPLGSGQDIIECQNCGSIFEPSVLALDIKPKRKIMPLADQLNTLAQRLKEGYPIEYAIADLTAAGLDRDIAIDSVRQAIGLGRRTCPECGLTYGPDATVCYEDQTSLIT